MKNLEWTRETPTEPGLYWSRACVNVTEEDVSLLLFLKHDAVREWAEDGPSRLFAYDADDGLALGFADSDWLATEYAWYGPIQSGECPDLPDEPLPFAAIRAGGA